MDKGQEIGRGLTEDEIAFVRDFTPHRPDQACIATALHAARVVGRLEGIEEAAKVACKSPCDFAGDAGHDCETCDYHRCLAAAVRALGKGAK